MKYLHIVLFIVCFEFIVCLQVLSLMPSDFFISSGFAEERLPDLKKGMTFLEVVKLWGSPKEKVEKEVKRRDIWVYASSRVIFEQGRLVTVVNNDGTERLQVESAEQKDKKDATVAANSGSKHAPDQQVVDDILSEIMKDPSNSENAESGKGVNPMVPPPVMQPPNMINPVPQPEAIN